MADKSSELILTALSRAAAAADGVPLHGGKTIIGLFPTNAAGKQAAQRSQEDGYLCLVAAEDALPSDSGTGDTATLVKKKTTGYPLCTITEKGLTYLLSQVSPRQVLEDFVRALEAREKQADDLLILAQQMQESIEALKANADKVLQHTYRPETSSERGGAGSLRTLFAGFLQEPSTPECVQTPPVAVPHDILLTELTRWHGAGASEDCPLPHLFRQLPAHNPVWSIGQFHDALRQLHDESKVYLHPWTGPLYDIPQPPYALLIGHEIAYYASIRR